MAIKICGHRLSNKLEKICAGATCENNFSEEEELDAYFEGLKIATRCCRHGCSEIQLEQLCCTFSYKKQHFAITQSDREEISLPKFINRPF
uniref:Uncharacterized protein n=1 Tax=Acrobeloides nanus TaxID=290746 RepID=A0A914EHJ1_9BILA